MKSFDVYLQRAEVPKWKEHYIDYAVLKQNLRLYGKRRRQLQRGDLDWSTVLGTNTTTANSNGAETDQNLMFSYALQDSDEGSSSLDTQDDRLSRLEHDDFKKTLQQELEKATQWFHKSWVTLQSTSFQEDEKHEEDGILDLYGFAVVNICVLRQLILKYNAHVRMYEGSMFVSEWEILQHSSQPTAASALMVSEVEQHGEESMEFSVQTVVPSLMALLEPLQDRMMTMPSYWMMSDAPELTSIRSQKPTSDFRARANELEALLEQTSWKQQTRQSPNKTERLLLTIRSFYMMGTAQLGISLEPKFLYAQVRGFKKEMKALAVWRERPLGAAYGGDDDQSTTSCKMGEMDPANVWPLFLNLVSCFLFMMNNYIIEPSSAYYANALGSSDALSGIMMGMAPWFALTSAVGYSVWTNKSYKQPILFAGTLMVIGNTLYGAAYSYQSMTMCLVGRAISGFGAPRIINRRYVADATPFSLRTISSAAFALTTALGAASGPGFAILLDAVPEFQFYLPFLGQQTFNGMTGPGFVMAALWFLYSVAIVVSFGEPNRSGLDELKQREAAAKLVALQKSTDESDAALVPPENNDDDVSVGSQSTGFHDEIEEVSKHSPLYCIKHMTRATALCMALIFMKRIALEVRKCEIDYVEAIDTFVICSCLLIGSISPHFLLGLFAEYCWIDFCHHQKPLRVVDSQRWNSPSGQRFDCNSGFHLCRMALAVPRGPIPGHVVHGHYRSGHGGYDRSHRFVRSRVLRHVQLRFDLFGRAHPIHYWFPHCLFGSRGLRVLCGLADEQVCPERTGCWNLQQRALGDIGRHWWACRGRFVYYGHGTHQHSESAESIACSRFDPHAGEHVPPLQELQDCCCIK